MKKFTEKHPIAYGIIFGYGLSLLFIFAEYFLTLPDNPIISEHWAWVDAAVRIIVGIIALIFLKIFYKDRFKGLFTRKVTAKTWLLCVPFLIYFVVTLMNFTIAKGITMQYAVMFIGVFVAQIATGFWEETAARGLMMCGMLDKWKGSVRGRIAMVVISGVLFGTLHTWGVIYGNDLISCLWQTLYSALWGMFVAAIYLYSGNLLYCMGLHAVWDIIVKIPDYFCDGVSHGIMYQVINTTQDVISLGVLPVIAILICIKYKEPVMEEITQ